jgi:hypothetical protein
LLVRLRNTSELHADESCIHFLHISIALALHQEYIELDLFNYGITRFSEAEFATQNMTVDDISLLRFFAQQEIGHATLLSNMLGEKAPHQCTYQYDFNNVSEFIDLNQKLTRWGESGVYGFLNLLDNRAVGQNLLQSITTEARQQYTFRQWEGLQPVPVWFETGVPQTYAWTLLSKYIKSCPSHNQALEWTIFPELTVDNNPSGIGPGLAAGGAAISHNISALTYVGEELQFTYDQPGKTQGPYGQKTMTGPHTYGNEPKYAAFFSQLNVTYSPLYDVTNSSAKAKIPGGKVLQTGGKEIINGTMFVSLTSHNPILTTANNSLINSYTVAGPAILQAG